MKHIFVLLAFCISQLLLLPAAEADFTFTLHIASHSTGFRCRELLFTCETFFPFFCLRNPTSGRDTSSTRCPLGKNIEVFDHNTQSGTRTISSSQPWQGGFQLYIRALDHDAGVTDPDHIADVFINLDLEANSGTTDLRTYTDEGISLQMTFRVDCQNDFYGPACTTFCQEQDDDTNGHYTCDPTDGSHICRQDYFDAPACNTFCQKQDDDVNGHFTCDPEDGSPVCLADYFGPDCLTFCQPEEGMYYCDPGTGVRVCEDGFTNPGNFCRENIDDCAGMPCENLGECMDLIDGYSCACAAGYTGRNCSIDIEECLVAECPLNSTCVEEVPGSFTCRCHSGFEGEDCTEIEPCTSDPCQNGGTCTSDGPFDFSCVCPLGVTGSSCQFGLSVVCGDKVCALGQTCIGQKEGKLECATLGPDSRVSGEMNMNVVVIGSVLRGLALIVILLIITVSICVCSKRKIIVYRADRSSHIYEESPTNGKGKFSESPLDEGMADNPLYNQPSPPPSEDKLQYYAHTGSTSSLHIVQNSLYQSTPNGDSVVYEQVGPRLLESADRLPNSLVTTNVAYAPGRSEKQECIDNPMYQITENKGSTDALLTYSVPRPVDAPHEGKGGYAPLSNSSTPSRESTSSGNTSPSVPLPNSGNTTLSEKTESTHYDVPTGGVAGGSGLDKEGSMQYSKLQHTDELEKPRRLNMDSDTGYQALQKQ